MIVGKENSKDIEQADDTKPLLNTSLAVVFAFLISLIAGSILIKALFTSPMVVVFSSVAPDEIQAVVKQLIEHEVHYEINENQTKVLVDEDDLLRTQLLLAGESREVLEKSENNSRKNANVTEDNAGFVLNNPGASLESELAKTIASLNNVRSSRVHLAIPAPGNNAKQVARASVVLQLMPDMEIKQSQVSAITHLLASSVPGLSVENVTVVDQNGRLLKSNGDLNDIVMSTAQFEYKASVESDFKDRINSFLGPFLGRETYKVQVSVELTKRTRRAAKAPVEDLQLQGDTVDSNIPRRQPGSATYDLKRVAVAVVVDNKKVSIDDGKYRRIARTKEELADVSDLVKKAISFNAKRGDRVDIVNIPFSNTMNSDTENSSFLHSGGWVLQTGKLGLIAILLLLVFWLTYRLATKLLQNIGYFYTRSGLESAGSSRESSEDGSLLNQRIGNIKKYQEKLHEVQEIVEKDPKLVAQVIRSWVQEDAQRV